MLIVVTGVMAAGKSTVAQVLAEGFERGAHVRGDVFRRMIVSGQAPITPELSDEAAGQLRLRYRLSARTANAYAAAGFSVVLQDIVLGESLTELVEQLEARPRHVVVLAPRPEVVAAREAGRAKTGYTAGWTPAMLDEGMRRDTPRIGLWLDSSEQTPEQTAAEIMDRLDEARIDRVRQTGR